ncbi:MAG: hypothetical protein GEU90_18745, partial [Gemmatimonas sp.]|nr:hypothetical protein [Gemmatimonas sp.]
MPGTLLPNGIMLHLLSSLRSHFATVLRRALPSLVVSQVAVATASGQAVPTSGTYAFVNVEVIPMEAPGTLPD